MTQWHRHPNVCLQIQNCRKQSVFPSKPAMGHQNNLFHIEQISQIQGALASKTSGLETYKWEEHVESRELIKSWVSQHTTPESNSIEKHNSLVLLFKQENLFFPSEEILAKF